ncbi:MAG: accessory Sec system translocase SecA2 [Acidobacteriota bacterium]|nr:accessory Sec system translocase SecA2 [Acidobacteriota bacterium]
MFQSLRDLFAPGNRDRAAMDRMNALRPQFESLSDAELGAAALRAADPHEYVAIAASAALRVLNERMFDVQLRGALALIRGGIAEMQTGEGKTLAAVPAIAWLARSHEGVHVMTVNDYLARRDAQWMGDIFRLLGLSVGFVQQTMPPAERRAAYACDITYATSNEIGFDILRDRLALSVDEQVHRPFHAAVIDEADSILIDEARVPLVIAGGDASASTLAVVADRVVRRLAPHVHYTVDVGAHNVFLTDEGIRAIEDLFACGNLYEERNLLLNSAVQDALHAHALLRRDVDYLVRDGAIEMVDEFKGRVALNRRWPAGVQTAVEAREGVVAKSQGTILGTTTIQDLAGLYPHVCGMTGTASTQSLEFQKVYDLRVETIPTNRPVIRVDHPDALFRTGAEKEQAVLDEIRRVYLTGQPILVGTASVEESERLSGRLQDVPHRVLNARNHEMEAGIVAQAGHRGAVTISTNMAGRGTDIRLGDGVAELGGLYVIGVNRHESRRIDNQLRGRAGRQGDPGCSRFFVSLEDPLIVKYRDLDPEGLDDPGVIQRLVEGQHLDQRLFLHGYDVPVEGQRNILHTRRQAILEGRIPCASDLERIVTLRAMDDLWADYLERLEDLRAAIPWQSFGAAGVPFLGTDRGDPHSVYLHKIDRWFPELEAAIPEEVARRMAGAEAGTGPDPRERGAVWTYLTTDRPFGSWTERVFKALRRKRKS